MEFDTWVAFVVASLVLTLTPGPSILLGMSHSIAYGFNKTIFTALGDITANFLQMVLVSLGLGLIIAASDVAFSFIKWFGIIFLIWMGVKAIFSKSSGIVKTSDLKETCSRRKLFFSGFLVAASNPKALVFLQLSSLSSLTLNYRIFSRC